MGSELERVGNEQLEAFKNQLAVNTSGSYFISDLSLLDISTDKLRLFTWLLNKLVMTYPEYVWQQTEGWDPNKRGIVISWRLKR